MAIMASTPHPFTLRQLQYALAVAETLSFRRAAERCRVAQPSLSARVAALEEALGVRLFERNRRRVLVTPAGAEVLERARAVTGAADALVEGARGAADPLAGRLPAAPPGVAGGEDVGARGPAPRRRPRRRAAGAGGGARRRRPRGRGRGPVRAGRAARPRRPGPARARARRRAARGRRAAPRRGTLPAGAGAGGVQPGPGARARVPRHEPADAGADGGQRRGGDPPPPALAPDR